MDLGVLLKIAGLGILVSLVCQVLKQNGRDELATVSAIVGLIVGTLLMLSMFTELVGTVRQVFLLY